MQNNNCDCPCRHNYRFILRAFTPNELNTEEIIPMTSETALEEVEGIAREEYNGRYPTFPHCLRIHLAHPASVMHALETCRCCQRHQQNRSLVNWTIFNASEHLPGAPQALPGDLGNWTDSETEHVSDSEPETDYGPDSP